MESIREIVLDLIEAMIILGIFQALYNDKRFIIKNKIRTVLFSVFYICVTYWSTFNMSMASHTPVVFISSILLMTWIIGTKIFNSSIVICFFLQLCLLQKILLKLLKCLCLI